MGIELAKEGVSDAEWLQRIADGKREYDAEAAQWAIKHIKELEKQASDKWIAANSGWKVRVDELEDIESDLRASIVEELQRAQAADDRAEAAEGLIGEIEKIVGVAEPLSKDVVVRVGHLFDDHQSLSAQVAALAGACIPRGICLLCGTPGHAKHCRLFNLPAAGQALLDGREEMATALKTLAKKESTWAHQEESHQELRLKDAGDYRRKINHVKAERDQLVGALDDFGMHSETCGGISQDQESCGCGYLDALRGYIVNKAALAPEPRPET